jgi:predicted signal transduction protein with EAL and GGDEF domain
VGLRAGNCDPASAELFARRVQRELREARLRWGRVTVSAGIAFYEEGMGSYEVLLAAADRALYAAKAAGRDRIEVYRTPAPAEIFQASVPAADREIVPHRRRTRSRSRRPDRLDSHQSRRQDRE